MPDQPTYPDTAAGALKVLEDAADERFLRKVKAKLENKELEWIPDPDHSHVWGTREPQELSDQKVVLIVYTDQGDWEIDDEWWGDWMS